MEDAFALLTDRHGLADRAGTSPEGLPERYLYSADMTYRYGGAGGGSRTSGPPTSGCC